MKRKLLYLLALITASLGAGPALSAPMTPVPAVFAGQLGEDVDSGESSPPDAVIDGQQTAVADRTAQLLAVREHGKQQAARAAFDLAELAVGDNDLGRADELLRGAVALQPENTDYLIAASRIAFVRKDYKYAEACLVKVLAVYRGTVVADSRKLLEAIDNLATLYHLQGKETAARSVLTEGLRVKTALFGEHHPRVIHNLYRLAKLDLVSANYGEAKQHLSRAVGLLGASTSPIADQDGAALLHNIGELYRTSGQHKEAESAYTKAMTLWNKSPSTNQRGIALTQAAMDRLHKAQDAMSSQAGIEIVPQVKDAPPVSSLLFESVRARM